MARRRYKPTLLLQCLIFVFVIGAGFAAFAIASVVDSGLPLLIALGTGAILILLSDLIIWVIISLMTRDAQHGDEESSPFWFVNSEKKRQEMERFHEDTKDNPTLR